MQSKPLVSVVMATYDMGQYVIEAVESVLNQDYPNIELIVVDDGSNDDTMDRLARYDDDTRVRVIHQENAGQTVAKNKGLNAATGDYVGFCDSDNCWHPDKLSKQLAIFREHPATGVVYGEVTPIDAEGKPLPLSGSKRYAGKITEPLLLDNFVTFNTSLTPHHIIKEVGGFDEKLRMGIDYDLWIRISVKYDFFYMSESLVDYRIWGGQMSHRTGERMENFFKLLANFLEANPGVVSTAAANRAWAHSYTTRGRWYTAVGKKSEAFQDFRKALGYRAYDLRCWKSLAKLVLGTK